MVEFGALKEVINETLEMTAKAYETEDSKLVLKVEVLEEIVDDMVDLMKKNHAIRLKTGRCTVERGVSFIEMLTDIERISDHCNNVCQHLLQRMNGLDLSTHDRVYETEEEQEAFDKLYKEYYQKYLEPIHGA